MTGMLLNTRPSSGVLVTPGGVPVPPPSVSKRLAEISPRLSVQWMSGAHKPYWALFVRWMPEDPRWEHVRSGQMPESAARDIEQMFPSDCGTEEMVAYVEQRWGDRARSTDVAKDAERIVNESLKAQSQVQEHLIADTVERGNAQHLAETSHSLRVRAGAEAAHPMVRGGLTE